jgi:hypothetical protein
MRMRRRMRIMSEAMSQYELDQELKEFIPGHMAWWEIKMAKWAQKVRDGVFGEVTEEYRTYGWGDAEPTFKMADGAIIKATESGVFEQMPSGGWGNISLKMKLED